MRAILIFNGSQSLGQAKAWDDKLREIKLRRGGGKGGYAARGSANTEGVQM